MDEKKLDVKQEEKTSEESSSSKETSASVKEDVQNTQEIDSLIDDLLADGTSKEKSVPYERFQQVNEKAKKFDEYSPILERLKENPELLDKLESGEIEQQKEEREDRTTLRKRVQALEEEIRVRKVQETRSAVQDAIGTWGKDFVNSWKKMQPILSSLELTGIPYKQALQQAYFAVNPDAIKEEKRLIEKREALAVQNKRGETSSSSSSFRPEMERDEDVMSEEDKKVASIAQQAANAVGMKIHITPELYKKHSVWLNEQGL